MTMVLSPEKKPAKKSTEKDTDDHGAPAPAASATEVSPQEDNE